MLKSLVNSIVIDAVRKRTGLPEPGALTAALLTTGASLLLSRGRRPIGVALIAVGGLLLWHEHTPETIDAAVDPETPLRPVPALPPHAPASDAAV